MDLMERTYRYGIDAGLRAEVLEAAILHRALPPDVQERAQSAANLRFPVKAADLCPPFSPGPALGAELKRLEELWIKTGFSLTQSELLSELKPPA
jgi:hypothetical protein